MTSIDRPLQGFFEKERVGGCRGEGEPRAGSHLAPWLLPRDRKSCRPISPSGRDLTVRRLSVPFQIGGDAFQKLPPPIPRPSHKIDANQRATGGVVQFGRKTVVHIGRKKVVYSGRKLTARDPEAVAVVRRPPTTGNQPRRTASADRCPEPGSKRWRALGRVPATGNPRLRPRTRF
jgi:hypothetical protein